MTILDRYIGRNVLYGTFLVLAVLIALFTFFEFVARMGDLGKVNFGFAQLFKYLALTTPRKIYELFPMAALLGTIAGLSSLAVDSELIAIRAAGVPLLRIVGSVMKVGMIFIVAAALIGEFVAPVSENLAQRGRAEAMKVGIQQEDSGIWLRDGTTFINVGEVLPDLSLLRINIFQFDDNNRLRMQTYAESGKYKQDSWRLNNISQSVINGSGVQIQHLPYNTWYSVLDPSGLAVFTINPDELSVVNLYRYIQHLRHNNQETGRYELAFWYKIISPLTTGVMVFLGIPFVFSQLRNTRMGSRLFTGIMLGLIFYVFNRGFGFFSLLYGIPPILGALLPTVVFFFLALYMLRRAA